MRARVWASSVLPQPVGPSIMMFDFCSSTSVVLGLGDLDPLVVVVDGDREGALGGLLADHVLLQHLVDLLRFGQVLQLEGGRRGQLLVDDLVAEVDALVADVDAGAGDQLLDLALRLAAEAAEELLVRVCGTCQRNPLLAGRSFPARPPQKLRGATSRACRVVYFAPAAVPPRERRGSGGAARCGRAAEGGGLGPNPAYQRFYEVDEIDDERNRAFFGRFLAPSDDGMLLGAWTARSWSATPASTGTSPRWSQRC